MKWGKAFLAGIIGAALMTIMMSSANAAGFHVLDFSMMWGTLVGLPLGVWAWLAGFGLHLIVGGLFALIYALVFNVFSGAGVLRGGGIGIVHAGITGIFLPLLPLVNPLMNNGHMRSPSPYFAGHGIPGVLFYFGMHVVYGITVGWLYARMVPEARVIPESDDLRIAA